MPRGCNKSCLPGSTGNRQRGGGDGEPQVFEFIQCLNFIFPFGVGPLTPVAGWMLITTR